MTLIKQRGDMAFRIPNIVAVLNVTPDSFSDGTDMSDSSVILARAEQLIRDGADVLDVGAESTRPDATPLTAEQEWERLLPVWESLYTLCQKHEVALSVDSYHPETVRRALAIGCDWVNDVHGFSDDPMIEAVRDSKCNLVAMHSLSIPADKTVHLPEDCDVIEEIQGWIDGRVHALFKQQIQTKRLILDPGIGFGKTAVQSLDLLMRVDELELHGAQLYIGHSRKSFMRLFDDSLKANARDGLTRAFSSQLAYKNVDYIRVHDVAGHRAMFDALN